MAESDASFRRRGIYAAMTVRPLLVTGLMLRAYSSAVTQQCSASTLIPAYAHNDYNNPHPLQDALELGYQGVEADYVFVRGQLLVAHSRWETNSSRTLESLYLAPLRARVQRCGWVQSSGREFLLNLESKEESDAGYRVLRTLLAMYSDLFGTPNDPGFVRVVLVGWHPPLRARGTDSVPPFTVQAQITRSGLELPQGDTALIGMVSLDYGKTLRWRGRGPLTNEDEQTLATIAAAGQALPGRLVRAFNVPAVPSIYRLLLNSGVDLIGAKNLRETAQMLARYFGEPGEDGLGNSHPE